MANSIIDPKDPDYCETCGGECVAGCKTEGTQPAPTKTPTTREKLVEALRIAAVNCSVIREDLDGLASGEADDYVAHAVGLAQRTGEQIAALLAEIADDRWTDASAAFREEAPWCGWTMAFAHGSDWDTTVFGLERLIGINVLLTTADGRSRPVSIVDWQRIDPAAERDPNDYERKAGIGVRELDTKDYEPLDRTTTEMVPYEDIREIVVY